MANCLATSAWITLIEVLGRGATALDEMLHGLLRILAAHLAGLDEIVDELFGVLLRHLAELRAGVDQTLEYWWNLS